MRNNRIVPRRATREICCGRFRRRQRGCGPETKERWGRIATMKQVDLASRFLSSKENSSPLCRTETRFIEPAFSAGWLQPEAFSRIEPRRSNCFDGTRSPLYRVQPHAHCCDAGFCYGGMVRMALPGIESSSPLRAGMVLFGRDRRRRLAGTDCDRHRARRVSVDQIGRAHV